MSANAGFRGIRVAVGFAVAATFVASLVPIAAARSTVVPPSLANGSFSNGLAHWAVVGSPAPCPWSVIQAYTTQAVCDAGYGFQEPAPADGTSFASIGFDRPTTTDPTDATLSQRLTIPRAARALHWQDFISWDLVTYDAKLPRVASVEIRNDDGTKILSILWHQTLQPGTVSLDTNTWTAHTADVSQFAGHSVTLVFHLSVPEARTGPATYSVDAIRFATN